MGDEGTTTVYSSGASNGAITEVNNLPISNKFDIAQRLRGGAIVEVTSIVQAKIAVSAGADCLLVSEPNKPGISRMADPLLIKDIRGSFALAIPIMARARVGHFVEAKILQAVGVDYIDESEILATADEEHFINKHHIRTPVVCGCRDLGEALRRVSEGAALIRSQGDLIDTGNIVQTVRSVRKLMGDIRVLANMNEDEVFAFSKNISAPYDIVVQTKQMRRLPVLNFAAGGISTPADAALMMQLGCDGVFISSDVFNCPDPHKKLSAILRATWNYGNPNILAETSSGLEDAMEGLNLSENRIERYGTGGSN